MRMTSNALLFKPQRFTCGIGRFGLWVLALLLPAMAVSPARAQQEIRFGVLGLFHPREMVLEPEGRGVLSITAQGEAGGPALVLNDEPGHRQIVFHAEEARVVAGTHSADSWLVTSRGGGMVAFQLIVPGKLRRTYVGRLTLEAQNGELLAVVSMERETAVASIVAAEMVGNSPIEALKAQAVATRSFLTAGQRHLDFDFCDTTHCQFLKSPPEPTSQVFQAVEATRGLVIAYRGKPLAAMYSPRCGGRTHSLRDVGADPGSGYPYFAVPCVWCRRHPFTWQSTIGKSAHAPEPGNERERIAQARQWGWSAIPGSDFTVRDDNGGWRLEGHSVGHGVGMCQHGAVGMAAAGNNFREILSHYYPNTLLLLQP